MNLKNRNSFCLISLSMIVEKTQPVNSYDHFLHIHYDAVHQFVTYQHSKSC
jgi:hypothetical protein